MFARAVQRINLISSYDINQLETYIRLILITLLYQIIIVTQNNVLTNTFLLSSLRFIFSNRRTLIRNYETLKNLFARS